MDGSPRVVSLLPSATEMCFALGVEPVGVSPECDYPPAASELPTVVRSQVTNEGSSETVNEQVAAEEASGGVYEVDLDALYAGDPDLVVAQGICDVCAIDSSQAEEAVEAAGLDAEVLALHSHSLDGVLGEVEQVGERLGRVAEAEELVGRLRERIEGVRRTAAGIEERPRVVVLDWMDPVMVAGHWVPELVEIAGGEYGMADPGDRSTPRDWAAICDFDPEVLVAAPCGFELQRTVEHSGELTEREGWDELTAVESGRAYAMDGHNFVNRPGPRLVETLEYFAGVVQPDRFEAPPVDAVRRVAARPSA